RPGAADPSSRYGRRSDPILIVVFLITCGSLFSSCSDPDAGSVPTTSRPPPWEEESGPVESTTATWSAEQRIAMADGVVSFGEYQEATRRYYACDTAHGEATTAMTPHGLSYRYESTPGLYRSGAEADCYERELRGIDMLWQLAQNAEEDWDVLASCLTARGFDVPENGFEMVRVFHELGIDQTTCRGSPP
ncbi:MAG: hypothetical protein PVI35_06950, partial [Acidimicrobiia bacterium]